MSWKIKTGLESLRSFECEDCRPVFSEVGGGYAGYFLGNHNRIYSFVTARIEAYSGYNKGYRYGPGFEAGVLLNPFENYKMHVQLGIDAFFDNVSQDERNISFQHAYSLSKNWEVRNSNAWYESRDSTDRFKRFETRLLIGRFYR